MRLAVMDGQGGGIGATVIKGLREAVGNDLEILALGTNSIATARMMKAGANRGGTGANAVTVTCRTVDVIIGPLAVIMANAMMGEVTPRMAEAVAASPARKVLIPLTREDVVIVGVSDEPLPHLVAGVSKIIGEIIRDV